jgi:plasmid stabilization system protein ParE
MVVRFSETALDALVRQAVYLSDQSGDVGLGLEFLDTMKRNISDLLADHPYAGHSAPEFGSNIRKAVVQSYSILYSVRNKTVEIHTIFRENLPKL